MALTHSYTGPYYPHSCPHDQCSPAHIPIADSSRPFSRDPSRAPGSIRLTQRVNLTSHHEHIIKHQLSHDTCPSPVSGKVQRTHAHITHIMHPTPANNTALPSSHALPQPPPWKPRQENTQPPPRKPRQQDTDNPPQPAACLWTRPREATVEGKEKDKNPRVYCCLLPVISC